MANFTLEDLAKIVAARADSGDPDSYTAKLTRQGIAALRQEARRGGGGGGDRRRRRATASGLKAEAADVLYHLLVLLHVAGVPFEAVTAELERRTAQTGLQEKAAQGRAADGSAPAAPSLSPYRVFSIEEWAKLRADTPMTLSGGGDRRAALARRPRLAGRGGAGLPADLAPALAST